MSIRADAEFWLQWQQLVLARFPEIDREMMIRVQRQRNLETDQIRLGGVMVKASETQRIKIESPDP